MALDNFQHRLAIGRVAGERSHVLGDARRLEIRLARHQRGDRGGVAAALLGVVGHPERHQQRAEVGIAEAELAELTRVLRDLVGRIRGVVDHDILRRDHHIDRVAECAHVELAALVDELHQVERREIARRVVEMHVLAARIRRVDASGGGAGVPEVDGGVELHAGVAACMRGLGDHAGVSSRAGRVSATSPDLTKWVCHSASSRTACMNSSVTRTELFAFWKNTEP